MTDYRVVFEATQNQTPLVYMALCIPVVILSVVGYAIL